MRPILVSSSFSKTGPLVDRFWSSLAPSGGMTLKELAPGVTLDEIKSKTEATFKVPNTL